MGRQGAQIYEITALRTRKRPGKSQRKQAYPSRRRTGEVGWGGRGKTRGCLGGGNGPRDPPNMKTRKKGEVFSRAGVGGGRGGGVLGGGGRGGGGFFMVGGGGGSLVFLKIGNTIAQNPKPR